MTSVTEGDRASGSDRGLAERWRDLSGHARFAIAAVAVVLGINVLLAALAAVTGGNPHGPPSSSYATAPQGLAAYADLLRDRGHPIGRIRVPLDEARLDHAATLVVADADDVTEDEAAAVARFVADGGRLVVTGSGAPDVLSGLPVGDLAWSPLRTGGDRARAIAPLPEVDLVTTVQASERGSWSDAGATLPVLAADSDILASVYVFGRGRVVALADTSPWQNRLLAQADNAAFGLAAAGEAGRPVLFSESHHGFGPGEGLAAIPSRWRWAITAGAVAAGVAVWAHGRRLGPPEEVERELPPPRQVYVDAIAASLARTGRPGEVIEPLRAATRHRLLQRAALPPDADDAAVRQSAVRLALPEEEVDALLGPVRGEDDVLAVGRLLARMEGWTV